MRGLPVIHINQNIISSASTNLVEKPAGRKELPFRSFRLLVVTKWLLFVEISRQDLHAVISF